MWSDTNEKEYKSLLEKFKINPKQNPDKEEIALLHYLLKSYIEIGDIALYNKITQFLNLFIDAELNENPNLLNFSNGSLTEKYPIVKEALNYPKKLNEGLIESARTVFKAYINYIQPYVDQKQYTQFVSDCYPDSIWSCMKPDSETSCQKHIGNIAFHKAVELLSEQVSQKLGVESETVLKHQQESLIRVTYSCHRAKGLIFLVGSVYNRLNVSQIITIPHIFYTKHETGRKPRIFPELNLKDVLPHEIFKNILKNNFKKARETNRVHADLGITALLLGKIMIEADTAFKGWTVQEKNSGKEPGFILIAPNKKERIFCKFTSDIYSEYFCSKVLCLLGVKMPESRLIFDNFENPFLGTRDLSREYIKGDKHKIKKFNPLGSLINTQSAWGDFIIKEELRSTEEQKKILEGSLTKILGVKNSKDPANVKTRISCAKLFLLAVLFNLEDFGGHGGNVGPIETQASEKETIKFGIVDFSFSPNDLTNNTDTILGTLENFVKHMQPIFQEIYRCLTKEDLIMAARELHTPKKRTYTGEGMLLMQSSQRSAMAWDIVEEVTQSVSKEINTTLIEESSKSIIEKIMMQKEIMKKNLQHFLPVLAAQGQLVSEVHNNEGTKNKF